MEIEDAYKELGVTEHSTRDQVMSAYRKLSLKYHPDRPDGDPEKFRKATEAKDKIMELADLLERNARNAGSRLKIYAGGTARGNKGNVL